MKLARASVEAGASAQAEVTVSTAGSTPIGAVEIRTGVKRVARARLKRTGTARIEIARSLGTGRHRLTAHYMRDASDRGSESKATVLHVMRRAAPAARSPA